jgi:hypothetical protein
MPTPARIRRTLDFNRLRQAMIGSNERSWVELGRVDDVDDAVTWLEGTGWVADVSFITGQLAEEAEIPCRIASHIGGDDQGCFTPVRPGCVVVVVVGAGNVNVAPVIIGYLHNPEDCRVPTEVNELSIDEDAALANILVKTIANYEAEYGDEVRIQAKSNMSLVSPRINLAPDAVRGDSTQAYVRGDEFGEALGSFLDGVGTFCQTAAAACSAAATALTPAPVVGPALGTWSNALGSAFALMGGNTTPPVPPSAVPVVPFATSTAGVFRATIADQPVGWKSTKIDGE